MLARAHSSLLVHSKCVPVTVASDMQDVLNMQSYLHAKAAPTLKAEIEAVQVRLCMAQPVLAACSLPRATCYRP